ncbi:MAG: glucans biosynthesis glucosyltransferase MdoH [Alkalilacustris sp.]
MARLLPRPAPRILGAMAQPDAHAVSPLRHVRAARWALGLGTLALTGLLLMAMADALAFDRALDWLALGLFALSVGWTSLAAGVSVLGLLPAAPRPMPDPHWRPQGRTAVLVMTCGEDPEPVAAMVRELHRGLARAGLAPGRQTGIFLLSDTRGPAARTEAQAFARLSNLDGVWWRQRPRNIGRKPGNLAHWLRGWSGDWDHMVVLDADSRMSPERIRTLVHRLESAPATGLVQAGLRLVPGRSRFGALQRLSSRLGGPGFGRGLVAWTGTEGNYWGHNAAMRVDAFAGNAARLPLLPGRAPMGGAVLSHDFVEAAFLRRAGWGVEIDPDARGSFEDGPQRLEEFHRRDRRWCQGNLQHLRLLAEPGLHPISRVHMLCGVMGYAAAPLWLGLVLTLALGGVSIGTVWPLVGGLTLLMVPKLAGTAGWLWRVRTAGRRRVVLRSAAAELGLSTLLAPILMLRQSLAVADVLLGRDAGWQPAGSEAMRRVAAAGGLEFAAGLSLASAAAAVAGPVGVALLGPVLGPLLLAPWLVRWFDAPRPGHVAVRPAPARTAPEAPPLPRAAA